MLYGDSLHKFPSICDRVDEIEKSIGVKRPLMVLPIVNKSTKKVKYKIRVDNYEDYTTLIGTWPLNSFKTGVKA